MRSRNALLALAICLASTGHAEAQTAKEYAIKASFISKFVGFIEWPLHKAAPEGPAEPFVVTIFGSDPFRGDLADAFANAGPDGRKVTVRRVEDVRDLQESKLIFIAGVERSRLLYVVRWAEEHGALTVGDGEGFAELGVIINFYLSGGKVRFEINKRAADKGGFQISSLLLKVARIVEDR